MHMQVLVVTAGASKAKAVASVRFGNTPSVPVVSGPNHDENSRLRYCTLFYSIKFVCVDICLIFQAYAHASDGSVHFYVDDAALDNGVKAFVHLVEDFSYNFNNQ